MAVCTNKHPSADETVIGTLFPSNIFTADVGDRSGVPVTHWRYTYRVSLCRDTTEDEVRTFLDAFTVAAEKSLGKRAG